MITLKAEENGDWNLRKIIKDKDAVAQQIRTSLLIFKGECFWDQEAGISYKSYIGMDENNEDLINTLKINIEAKILNIYGVKKIKNLSIKIENNIFSVYYEVEVNDEIIQGSLSI